ncbi:hypothetical protein CB1_000816027 [Camelus ferus]|nr:hypothetical protein CB1_000816027 [Camelus ferus]
MKGKLTQLHHYMHNLSDQLLSMETAVNSLFHIVSSQQLQNPVGSKTNAFEKRLENITTTLNNLQQRLEEVSSLSRITDCSALFKKAVPEPASQDPKDVVDSGILEEKPKIIISFIKNLTDLQIFFYGADHNANGYLTYSEIESLLGEETPAQEQLELFDADNNKTFSYPELIRAFGLTGPLKVFA